MSLATLPTELQCAIIRLLDPVTIISISQTSNYFRRLVDPKKKHLVERLLALETLAEYGGPSFSYRARHDHDVVDPWSRWELMRWTCADCVRLLSHRHFDNHSLFRLRYRKPIPGSPASCPDSTWEPADHISRSGIHRKRGARDTTQEELRRRQRYGFCVTIGYDLPEYERFKRYGVDKFEDMSQAEFDAIEDAEKREIIDKVVLSFELEHCGNRRQYRRCNECRYLRGEMKGRLTGPLDTIQFPVATSRLWSFNTPLDRWFPRFQDFVERRRPVFASSGSSDGTQLYSGSWSHNWGLYMARCSGCRRWKEVRDFRLGALYHHWKPSSTMNITRKNWDEREINEALLSESRCNSCFAAANGEQELAAVLLRWMLRILNYQLVHISNQLKGGFSTLTTMWPTKVPDSYRLEIERMRKKTRCMRQDNTYKLTYDDVALLKQRQDQWLGMWDEIKQAGDVDPALRNMDSWCDYWRRTFESWERHWRWYMECKQVVEQSPELLAEWALVRNGFELR